MPAPHEIQDNWSLAISACEIQKENSHPSQPWGSTASTYLLQKVITWNFQAYTLRVKDYTGIGKGMSFTSLRESIVFRPSKPLHQKISKVPPIHLPRPIRCSTSLAPHPKDPSSTPEPPLHPPKTHPPSKNDPSGTRKSRTEPPAPNPTAQQHHRTHPPPPPRHQPQGLGEAVLGRAAGACARQRSESVGPGWVDV